MEVIEAEANNLIGALARFLNYTRTWPGSVSELLERAAGEPASLARRSLVGPSVLDPGQQVRERAICDLDVSGASAVFRMEARDRRPNRR